MAVKKKVWKIAFRFSCLIQQMVKQAARKYLSFFQNSQQVTGFESDHARQRFNYKFVNYQPGTFSTSLSLSFSLVTQLLQGRTFEARNCEEIFRFCRRICIFTKKKKSRFQIIDIFPSPKIRIDHEKNRERKIEMSWILFERKKMARIFNTFSKRQIFPFCPTSNFQKGVCCKYTRARGS